MRSASFSALQAKVDTVWARANRLAAVKAFNQFTYTEGNGTPFGVFAGNDGPTQTISGSAQITRTSGPSR